MKVRNLIIFFSFLIIVYLIIKAMPKSYEYDYVLNGIVVVESYNKKEKVYSFKIDEKYTYNIAHKYISKRGLLNKIKKIGFCIEAESSEISDFSLCIKNGEFYTSYYDVAIEAKIKESYEDIDIYDLNSKTFLVWHYNGFISINEEHKEKIKLFEEDVYSLDIITKLKNYLLVADYNQKYKFDKLYLINYKNNKVKEIKLDKEVYFNSYILGTHKSDIYLYDIQKETEYKINPFKEVIKKNSYEVLVDNKWEKTSANKLNKKEVKFKNENIFEFSLKDNKLLYKSKDSVINVIDMKVDKIIEANEVEAYFVSDGTLYYVNIVKGATKIMRYNEWNYNFDNIYVF